MMSLKHFLALWALLSMISIVEQRFYDFFFFYNTQWYGPVTDYDI